MRLAFKTLRLDWSFIVLTTLIFALALLVTVWDYTQLQKMAYSLGLMNAVAVAFFAAGTILRQLGKRTLGRYYSYGLRTLKDQKLIQHGVYKYVRHPITLAALIYTPAIPLIFSSLYGFVVMLGIVPLFLFRIRIEEKMLVEKFGDEYHQYMRRTKKLVPLIY